MRKIFPADSAAADLGPVGRDETGPVAESAAIALADLYAYPDVSTHGRPWLRANMIVSADGAASLAGRSGGLSGPADRLVFSVLRSLADVILVGAATARVERYRPASERNIWAALREGRPPTPRIAVVTRKLSLDPDSPLYAGAPMGSRTIVLTTAAAPPARLAAAARHADVIVAGEDTLTPAAAIDALAERGYRRLLTEGGPLLLAQFAAAGLLDDLCLTISPVLEGGRADRILTPDGGAGGAVAALRLVHVLEDRGSLLCRYLRDTG